MISEEGILFLRTDLNVQNVPLHKIDLSAI